MSLMGWGCEGLTKIAWQALWQRPAGTYRCAPTGVEEEVRSVGSCGWLIGDGTVAQCHAHNGRHVSLGAKHVDGDPSGLPCEGGKRVHHSGLQIRAQVHTTLQRSSKVLPDAWHFLCKTKSAAQVNCQIFISKQTCGHKQLQSLHSSRSQPGPSPLTPTTLPHTPASLAWPCAFLCMELSSQRPSPSCSCHSAQVPPPDDLESRSPPQHPACFTTKSPDSISKPIIVYLFNVPTVTW